RRPDQAASATPGSVGPLGSPLSGPRPTNPARRDGPFVGGTVPARPRLPFVGPGPFACAAGASRIEVASPTRRRRRFLRLQPVEDPRHGPPPRRVLRPPLQAAHRLADLRAGGLAVAARAPNGQAQPALAQVEAVELLGRPPGEEEIGAR